MLKTHCYTITVTLEDDISKWVEGARRTYLERLIEEPDLTSEEYAVKFFEYVQNNATNVFVNQMYPWLTTLYRYYTVTAPGEEHELSKYMINGEVYEDLTDPQAHALMREIEGADEPQIDMNVQDLNFDNIDMSWFTDDAG